jgi:hypothetical protein
MASMRRRETSFLTFHYSLKTSLGCEIILVDLYAKNLQTFQLANEAVNCTWVFFSSLYH